ncbi:MAG TPA: glycosyltransferase family 4 protein [bacterium]|nr:glycosyltransferase family 4 protein [bacterium]
MKILFANTIQMFGGGEVWMLRALEALRRRGHTVALLCRPGTEVGRRATALGLTVHYLAVRGDFGPITIWRAARLLRRHRYQIVLTNMDKELRFMGLAARLVGGCRVIARRGIDYPLKNRLRYRFSYNGLAAAVIANSQATKQALLRNAPWLDPERVHVIYNGIDPAPFLAPGDGNFRRRIGVEPDVPLIGFVGQLDERKGMKTLLPAFQMLQARLPACRLVLVGEGPLRSWIETWRREHGLEEAIVLAGFHARIEEVMRDIDVLVLPSLWEGFGIVLIEAMAAGKPCVTTRISSMPEIVVDGETGRVVPVEESGALAEALFATAGDRTRAAQWGEAGRRRVQAHFTLDRMVHQLEALFDSLLQAG